MSFEKNLDKYAKLAIKVGVNIQEGQTLLVRYLAGRKSNMR